MNRIGEATVVRFDPGRRERRSRPSRACCQSEVLKKAPDPLSWFGRFYWWGLQRLISRLVCWKWVAAVKGQENLPAEPFIIAANHASFLDFMVVIGSLRRYLVFLVAKRYFDMPIWKFFLTPMGQIRANGNSIRKAVRAIRDQRPVVLFPEGTRTRTGILGNGQPGLAAIALFSRVPIVPVGLRGAFETWPRPRQFPHWSGRIEVVIGQPILPEEFAEWSHEKLTEEMMARIRALVEE